MGNITKAFQMVLSNYVGFTGRATRSEFWYYFLAYIILFVIVNVVGGIIGSPFLSMILGLGVLLPTLAVEFRRLHDTGRSAWWLLVAFIPLVGIIVLIYFWAQPSEDGDNSYGAKPTF